MTQFSERAAGDVEARIGKHVATLVRDGDTLQFGIGGIPLAVAHALTSHRRLRMHSGMVTRAMQDLWQHDAMDRDHRITTGAILGDQLFMDFAAHLENLWVTDIRHTHNVAGIGRIPRFTAVNGAIEVDLFGQVNAERTADGLVAGAGGLPAFAQGAHRAPRRASGDLPVVHDPGRRLENSAGPGRAGTVHPAPPDGRYLRDGTRRRPGSRPVA